MMRALADASVRSRAVSPASKVAFAEVDETLFGMLLREKVYANHRLCYS